MSIESLKKANQLLNDLKEAKLSEDKNKNEEMEAMKMMMQMQGQESIIEAIKENRLTKEDIKEALSELKIEPQVNVNVPDIKIPDIKIPEIKSPIIPEIKIPEIKIPDIKIPKIETPKIPEIRIPEIKIPKIEMPDKMTVDGEVELKGYGMDNPLPVQLRDAKGKPMEFNFGGVGTGNGGGARERTLTALHEHFSDDSNSAILGALNEVLTFSNLDSKANVTFQIVGTLQGRITFEAQIDSTWTPIYGFLAGTGQTKTEYTNPASGTIYRCSTGGFSAIRFRISNYTSGSITVYGKATHVASGVFINFPIPQGGNLIGIVNLADSAGATIEPATENGNLEDLSVYVSGALESISASFKSIDIQHARIHLQQHYNANDSAVITSGNNKDYLLITPNTTTRCHFIFSVETDGKATVLLNESAITSANGTGLTAYNNDRNSANVATLSIYEDPTVTGAGTTILPFLVGSSQKAGGNNRGEEEFILKQNTKYLLRITAAANLDAVVKLNWYEV